MEIRAGIAFGEEPIRTWSLRSYYSCRACNGSADVRARGSEVHWAFDDHWLIGVNVHSTLPVDANRPRRGCTTLSRWYDDAFGGQLCATSDVGYSDIRCGPSRRIQDSNETGVVALRFNVSKVVILRQLC